MILLKDVLKDLTLRERNILTGYYLYGYNQREIAEHYNISHQMVSKIRRKALEKCKEQLSAITA